MIVFPMLGKSSRFFSKEYLVPKYELPLGELTLFTRSVRSFDSYFDKEHFLFLVRKDNGAKNFVLEQIASMDIKDFRIIEIDRETSGQAESVFIGLSDYSIDKQLMIFNIDTIRDGFIWPTPIEFGDGFLEVFRGPGENWSFVESSDDNVVVRTSEKLRISDLCSNGIYGFSSIDLFGEAYLNYQIKGEKYIAPLFNYLIDKGLTVRFRIVDTALIHHCGVPADYESQRLNYSNPNKDRSQ